MTIMIESLERPSGPETGPPVANQALPKRQAIRFLQSIGAMLVTVCVFVMLFGVPARLLFGIFFD